MNPNRIKLDTGICTLIGAILGILSGTLATKYPDAAFWCGAVLSPINGAVLLFIKSMAPSDEGKMQLPTK